MILSVENGCFAYKNCPPVLNDLSFTVEPGELLAVLGPNGAGKTTLLKCIMGLLRWTSGRSLLDGQDIKNLSERKLFSSIAYVPQARAASPAYTALETVLLGRSSRIGVFSTPKEADIKLAESVLKKLGVGALRDKLCSRMSGGELQMVLIAKALAAEPGILILDEPESNLDFKNQLIVLDTVSSLASRGIACIFNTHYPEHALQRSDKALLLSPGNALYGPTSAVVTESNIERAFGVKAKIGHIETGESIVRSVIPMRLSQSEAAGEPEADPAKPALAAVTVISHDYSSAQRINSLLHEYGDIIIGRMGMPYRKRGVYIINASLDGPKASIDELTHRLSIIPGVSIKTTFAREDANE